MMDFTGLAQRLGDIMLALFIIGLLIGIALALGIPWLWHFVAAHISFH